MIIKSAPPASSNLADMPVPAPHPIIGSPLNQPDTLRLMRLASLVVHL